MGRKKSSRKYLAETPVLIVDNKYESQYFQVSDFPTQLHAGKNMFRLSGNSDLLLRGSIVEIEIMPENGVEPIYHEVNNYTDNSNRKLISIYIYPEDLTGLATVTIRGTATRRPGGRFVRGAFQGRPNVKWSREIYVDPSKPNTTPIIFGHQPRITITENVKPYLSESFSQDSGINTVTDLQEASTFTYTHTPAQTYNNVGATRGGGGQAANSGYSYSTPPQTTIQSSNFQFSASMVGGTLMFPNPSSGNTPTVPSGITIPSFKQNGQPNTTDYTCSIVSVVNTTTCIVDKPYSFEYSYVQPGTTSRGTPAVSTLPQTIYATHTATQMAATAYSASWQGEPTLYTENNYNLVSYANIVMGNLAPMAGDVYRVKTCMKSHGMQTWDILADEIVEQRELLANPSNIFRLERTGRFINQSTIDDYWAATSTKAGGATELKADSEVLMEGMIISGSKDLANETNRNSQYVRARCTRPIEVFRNCEYQLSFKARAFAEVDDGSDVGREYMKVFMSGSGVDYDPIGSQDLGRRMDSNELRAPYVAPVSPIGRPYMAGPSIPMAQVANIPRSSTVATATSTGIGNIPDFTDNSAPAYDSDNVVYTFVADHDGFVVPVFAVHFGKWLISEVSIKAISEDGFTPNHTIIEARVPEYQEDDVLDFKFEFFDYNGVRADLILVSESIDFAGGNTYINGEGFLGEGIIFDGQIGG